MQTHKMKFKFVQINMEQVSYLVTRYCMSYSIAYSIANYLNVKLSISIIWIREKSSDFSAIN